MGELCGDPLLRDRASPFRDRAEGGRALAALMRDEIGNATILAIPAAGVPVASALSNELSSGYGLFFAQRIEHPDTGESLGGMAWGGRTVWDRGAVKRSGLEPSELRSLRRRTLDSLRKRARKYGTRPVVPYQKRVVLVDDGSGGWAVLAAVREARAYLSWVAVAVPVMKRSEALLLVNEADVLYCPCLVADGRASGWKGWWGRAVREPEALAIWSERSSGPLVRNLYHTV